MAAVGGRWAAQKRLLEQLRQLELTKDTDKKAKEELASLDERRHEIELSRTDTERTADAHRKVAENARVSLADIEQRRKKINEEVLALEKLPPMKKVLRYRTPVSRPVHSSEWHFECKQGRVSFVDVTAMLDEVRSRLRDKGEQLKSQWKSSDVTEAVGAFRMHYVIERQRDGLDGALGLGPAANASYGYGLSECVIEPIAAQRGETADVALGPQSDFRHVCDGLSPALATVTFWVYPDSFAAYRQLRDYLADRDISVAGRPMPEGVPITCSRRGSLSRGQ